MKTAIFGIPIYRWLTLAGFGIALLALSIFIRGQLNIEWSVESFRNVVESFGFWAPLVYVGILGFRFLFLIPSGILLVGAGVLFGPIYGTIYAGMGLFLSAMIKYLFVGIIGREAVLRQLPPRLQIWVRDIASRKMSAWALVGICAYPFVPKHIFQVAAILSGMRLPAYTMAVLTGSFVRAAIFANIGGAIYSGSGLIATTVLLLVLIVFPLCIPSWRHWMLGPIFQSSTRQQSRESSL